MHQDLSFQQFPLPWIGLLGLAMEPASPSIVIESSTVEIIETSKNYEDIENTTDLAEQNRLLKAKIQELSRKLGEAEEVNQELTQAKTLLSDEIVDLTKVLFEEANGMVANEVKARIQLEQARRKLQVELDAAKDRLRVESQQLQELKQKLYEIAQENSSVSLNSVMTPSNGEDRTANFVATFDLLTRSGNYFDLFLPERRFTSKIKCNGVNSALWDEIVRSLDMTTFQSFSKFLENIGQFDDEALLGTPFVKKIYENDVVPCLSFESKPKTFIKKMVWSMFKNICTIDVVSPSSPLPSPVGKASPVPSRSSTPCSIQTEHSGLNNMMSELASSFSALPDLFTVEQARIDRPAKSNPSKYCYLCGSVICRDMDQRLYRLRLSEKDEHFVIDDSCRNKLVAVAEFYTFLRHLRKGLFSNRPIIDLYFDILHYLRSMFYARTHSVAFFAQSDFEIFQ